MISIDKMKCTACGACVQRCPNKCISWIGREFGFRYPQIDQDKCCGCNLCESVCPIGKNQIEIVNQQAYAVVHKDKQVLEKSTSGGAFSALADYIFAQNGVVYGTTMDEDFRVRCIRIDKPNAMDQLRGSKYVQSNTDDAYIQAERDLKQGKYVLFTGTPCQVAGLNGFLGKKYEKLVTADIVCHGVGSQDYFDRFMEFLQLREGKIRELRFRCKEFAGWSVGGTIEKQDGGRKRRLPFYNYNHYYYYYYLHGDIYRESCYSCPYAGTTRPGDFTMGDFWGVEALRLPINTDRGCSLVLTNTPKAKEILLKIDSVFKAETTMKTAVAENGQLQHPSSYSAIRSRLLDEYEHMSGAEIDKRFRENHSKEIFLMRVRAKVPYRWKLVVRRFRNAFSFLRR